MESGENTERETDEEWGRLGETQRERERLIERERLMESGRDWGRHGKRDRERN